MSSYALERAVMLRDAGPTQVLRHKVAFDNVSCPSIPSYRGTKGGTFACAYIIDAREWEHAPAWTAQIRLS